MKNKLELLIKSVLTSAIIMLCIIIVCSSCTTPQKVAMKTQKYTAKDSTITLQMVNIDSLGREEVLPPQKGLRK